MPSVPEERFDPALLLRLRSSLSASLASTEDLRWAYLFGSAARGEPFADLDVAVMPRDGSMPSALDLSRLGATLTREAGVDGLNVEVTDLRTATLPFLGALLDDAEPVLDREPEARRYWEAQVTLRWLDFEPAWTRYEEQRLAQLREGAWLNGNGRKGS